MGIYNCISVEIIFCILDLFTLISIIYLHCSFLHFFFFDLLTSYSYGMAIKVVCKSYILQWVIPENISTILWVASGNSKGDGGPLDWNSKGMGGSLG